MAGTAYLRVPDLKSRTKATDLNHRGWIVLDSVRIGSSMGNNSGGVGRTRKRGSVGLADLSITREMDEDTPELGIVCAKGMPLSNIVIEMWETAKGSSSPTLVRIYVKQAYIVRRQLQRPPPPRKGKGNATGGKEMLLLRCEGVRFRQG